MSHISQIDGQSVRLKRESFGWAISDMATMACLSSKQIKQIEEGGLAAFYSESVKLTAARKVAGILQMTEAELFGQAAPQILEKPAEEADIFFEPDTVSVPVDLPNTSLNLAEAAPLMRSESWHFLAQPPEVIPENNPQSQPQPHSESSDQDQVVAIDSKESTESTESELTQTPIQEAPAQDTDQPSSSTNNMIKVVALFLVALAAAALLKQNYPDDKTEAAAVKDNPPPPAVMAPAANAELEQQANTNAQATGTAPVNAVQTPSVAAESNKTNTQPAQANNPAPAAAELPASATGK